MIKNHLLYQLSYAGGSDPGQCLSIARLVAGLRRLGGGWYARQDSNLQPSGSKPDALSS